MIKFELDQQQATNLINLLGQLPTNSGVFPTLVQMVAQYNEQTKEKGDEPANNTED